MEAKELRIGNLAQDQNGNLLIVDALTKYDVIMTVVDRSKFPLFKGWQAEPIPLTEEWLLKFPWKKIDKYTYSYKGWFIYNRKRGLVTGSKNRERKLEYVHDFQNWWHGNNGYDLELIN